MVATPSRRGPLTASAAPKMRQVSGNPVPGVVQGSASVFRPGKRSNPRTDRNMLAQPWQIEMYRQVNICGEARYAVTLFANLAARAEIGVSEPTALARKAVWVNTGPEVDAFAELCPTVRDRSKLIRDYMTHWTIAGECYLIARARQENDPEYDTRRDEEIWEIVAVTEIQKVGITWRVRYDNGNYIDLAPENPVIRMWNPDPSNRREGWSPLRSMESTLREIEWATGHIFTQIRSRMMSAGVWFLPNNLTYPTPPSDSVEGGDEAIATLNESELFMLMLAESGTYELDMDEVAFPTVVQADPAALDAIDQSKLIKFWSEIDDKVMVLRSDSVRRFALGMDLPPEQVLGSSGLAVSNSGGSAGSVNHWGEWAKEEQTIKAHIEPALDTFVAVLSTAFLAPAVPGTTKVIGYDTASMRLRQDRSKEAIELYDRGLLKGEVTVREVGFDPENDMMDTAEHRIWLLNRIAGGSMAPEQIQAALALLGVTLPVALPPVSGNDPAPKELPGRNQPRSLEQHPYEGPPRGDHEHKDAAYAALVASCEALTLRALEKAGNRLLNDRTRGKDKDRSTPAHLAHVVTSIGNPVIDEDFDFSLAGTLLGDVSASVKFTLMGDLARFCADLYNTGTPYSREAMIEAVKAL